VPVEDRFHRGVTAGQWRERLRIPEDAPVLGIVGKVAAGRGFDVAVETVRSVGDGPHLIAVGHGDLLAHVQRSATDAGVDDRIHWLGYRDTDLPGLYATTDVVLFMGAGSDHGHRAITEAQACSRPIVAANIAGVGDLVEDGVTGRIVDPTPQAFAGAVTDLLADRSRLRAIGLAAAAAAEHRRMATIGARLMEFLNGLSPPQR
jgi:glycosyltransferase involved in cell wall biosynthesis